MELEFSRGLPEGHRTARASVNWGPELAEALRRKPGYWALVKPNCASKNSARVLASLVRRGKKEHLPHPEFDADAVYTEEYGWSVYVRALPKSKWSK